MKKVKQIESQNDSCCPVDEDDYEDEPQRIYTAQALVANIGGTGLSIQQLLTELVQAPCAQNDYVAVASATIKTSGAEVKMTGAATPAEMQGDVDPDRLLDRASKNALSRAYEMLGWVRASNFIQEERLRRAEKEDSQAIGEQPALKQSSAKKAVQKSKG